MVKLSKTIAAVILMLSINIPCLPSFAEEDTTPLTITGYYKNLFSTSKTLSTKEVFISHLQRMRFEFKQKFTPQITGTLIYDNNIILNDFSGTSDFDLIREQDQRRSTLLDLDEVFFDEKYFYWEHAIYRAYVQYYTPSLQFVIGKQAIDWSRMRFYHPFDLFNPISPLDLEQDEKMGVDAINLEYYPKPFLLINFIYAPYRNRDRQGLGLRLSSKVYDYDISAIAAEVRKNKILGLSFDGYIKNAGFRGEGVYTYKDNEDDYFRGSIGLDYSFTSKLYGLVEYLYNGDASIDKADSFLGSFEFSREAMTMTKHILGGGLEYEFSGVTKLNNYIFYDFEGESLFYNPQFKWNIKPNFDLTVGIQFFYGDDDSEYGSYHDLFYAEMKFFF